MSLGVVSRIVPGAGSLVPCSDSSPDFAGLRVAKPLQWDGMDGTSCPIDVADNSQQCIQKEIR